MAESPVDFLQEWAQEVTDAIRNNLVSKDKWFDESTLAQSIVALPVEVVPDGYVLRIQMNDYGMFVDQGRKSSNKMPPIKPIEEWWSKRAYPTPLKIKVQVKTKRGIKSYNRTFKNTLESRRSFAFATALGIKRKGYTSKGKGFYSEIVNGEKLTQLTQMLSDKFGATFEADIIE